MFTSLLGWLGFLMDLWFLIAFIFIIFVISLVINDFLQKKNINNKFTEFVTMADEEVFDFAEDCIYNIQDFFGITKDYIVHSGKNAVRLVKKKLEN